MLRPMLMVLAVAAARPAQAADCIYDGADDMPPNLSVCAAQTAVPQGCPMYVVTRQGGTLPSTILVQRGMSTASLDVTATIDSSMTPFFETINFIDCDCQSSWAQTPFDMWKVTVAGAQRGDLVDFGPGAELTTIAVTDAGPCPSPVWPSEFREEGVCGLKPHCHPTQPYSRGCVTGSASPLALIGVMALMALARRRR